MKQYNYKSSRVSVGSKCCVMSVCGGGGLVNSPQIASKEVRPLGFHCLRTTG